MIVSHERPGCKDCITARSQDRISMAVNRAHPAIGCWMSRTHLKMMLPCHSLLVSIRSYLTKLLRCVLKSDSMIMCHWASCQDDRPETDPVVGYSLEPSRDSSSDLQLGGRLLGCERSNIDESD